MTNKSKNSRHNRAVMWKSTLIILFGVFVMGSLTVYVVSKSPSMKETLEAERPIAREALVHLFALSAKSKSSEPKSSKPKEGSLENAPTTKKLIFEVSSNVPIYVALLVSGNNARPDILLSEATIPPGEGKPLSQGIDRFVYTSSSKNQKNTFCIVQGQTRDELSLKLRRLSQIWPRIPKTQCVIA